MKEYGIGTGNAASSGSWTQALELRKAVKAEDGWEFTPQNKPSREEKPQKGVSSFYQILRKVVLRRRPERKRR